MAAVRRNNVVRAALARCGVESAQIVCCRCPERKVPMRSGATLIELIVVMMVIGVLTTVAGLRVAALRDRVSVHAAATEAVATFAVARRWSRSRAARTAVTIDTSNAALVVRSYADTVVHRRLGSSHGVVLSSSRDSMAYAPNGLGYGAANLTLVVRRGQSAETIFVSRLGRVRH